MKTVSEDYKIHMNDVIRSQSHAQIEVFDGVDAYIFTGDKILSIAQTDDVDPLSRRLPTETVKFSISDLDGEYSPYSPTGIWERMDTHTIVAVRLGYTVNGEIEWLETDNYRLDGKPVYENGVVTFEASRRLAHLTELFYKADDFVLTPGYTLKNLATKVLSDAQVPSNRYELDPFLDEIDTFSVLPIATHAECLQMIAHAAGCTLFTKPDGKICIKKFEIPEDALDFALTRQSIQRGKETTDKNPVLRMMSNKEYHYGWGDEEILAQFNATAAGTYHVEYDLAYSPSVDLSSGAITSNWCYGRAADITVNAPTTITIEGHKIYPVVTTKTTPVSSMGEDDTEDNPLMLTSNPGGFEWWRELYADYLSHRLIHTVSYRGNPELQCGDAIYYETPFGTLALALVLSTQIVFNGAISGTLILKNLANYTETELYDSYDELVIDKNDEQIQVTDSEPYYSDYSMDEMDDFIEEVLG